MMQVNTRLGPSVVLIVDDDPTTCLLAEEFLTEAGFIVFEAPDGETALLKIPEIEPDIVLLDISMPGMDGFTVCEHLRRDVTQRDLPVMMLTSNEDLGSIQRAYEVGATDFTSKPVNWPLLSYRLLYLLRGADTMRALGDAQRSAALGSWLSMVGSESMNWSDELYRQLCFEPHETQANWQRLEERVPEQDKPILAQARDQAIKGQAVDINHRLLLPNGNETVVRHRIELVSRKNKRSALLRGTIQDITDLHEASERIYRLAYYDPLTKLPNRSSFQENLDRSLLLAKRYNRQLAVIYLDLDDFKRINDTLGHTAGDMLLSEAASRLKQAVRGSDLISRLYREPNSESPGTNLARLGGDEFAIVLNEIKSTTEADEVAQRILEKFSLCFSLDGNDVFTTSSIGIACYPRDGADSEALLKYADSAMYEAKRAGKNGVRVYDAALSNAAQRRHQLDQRLRQAIERNELMVVYQPQLDLNGQVIKAVEALLRWNTKDFGAISPVEFIPLAEENGLIIPIGNWVLHTACMQLKIWREQGFNVERMSVNVSVKQFAEPTFIDDVSRILTQTECNPSHLELEITESVLASNADEAVKTLNELKQLGINLSIDDFGTGYSSLSYLKRFPIDRLKIDRSFVRDIVSDPNDASITSAIIAIARSMGLKVIAEGVEDIEQLELLKSKGCDEIQGYHISRPRPAIELKELFETIQNLKKQ